MLSETELETCLAGYRDFLVDRKTVVIATTDENGVPFQSIAPFAGHDGALYVYLSEIADHFRHLSRADHAHVFFHADEAVSANIFGMERASFACAVERVEEEGHDAVFEKFGEKSNPKMVKLLRTLDFHLFRLTPRDGRYVVGFGKAFDVSFDGTRFEHVVIDKKPVAAEAN